MLFVPDTFPHSRWTRLWSSPSAKSTLTFSWEHSKSSFRAGAIVRDIDARNANTSCGMTVRSERSTTYESGAMTYDQLVAERGHDSAGEAVGVFT